MGHAGDTSRNVCSMYIRTVLHTLTGYCRTQIRDASCAMLFSEPCLCTHRLLGPPAANRMTSTRSSTVVRTACTMYTRREAGLGHAGPSTEDKVHSTLRRIRSVTSRSGHTASGRILVRTQRPRTSTAVLGAAVRQWSGERCRGPGRCRGCLLLAACCKSSSAQYIRDSFPTTHNPQPTHIHTNQPQDHRRPPARTIAHARHPRISGTPRVSGTITLSSGLRASAATALADAAGLGHGTPPSSRHLAHCWLHTPEAARTSGPSWLVSAASTSLGNLAQA